MRYLRYVTLSVCVAGSALGSFTLETSQNQKEGYNSSSQQTWTSRISECASRFLQVSNIAYADEASPHLSTVDTGEAIQTFHHPDYTLKQVQVVFRHGARTPIRDTSKKYSAFTPVEWEPSLMDTLPHTDVQVDVRLADGSELPASKMDDFHRTRPPLLGGCWPGQLTTVGQHDCYLLGNKLKQAYVIDKEFIGQAFDSSEVFLRTTNMKRTITSLRCCLAGLFGAQQAAPYPVTTEHNDFEICYPNFHACKSLGEHREKARTTMSADWLEENASLAKLAGAEGGRIDSFLGFVDEISCRMAHRKPIPDEILTIHPLIVNHVTKMIKHIYASGGSTQKRLAAGNFIHTIATQMEHTSSDQKSQQFRLYSCHDTTLISLLALLDCIDKPWPTYASHLIFEVYQNNKQNNKSFVRIVYQHEPFKFEDGLEGGQLLPLKSFLQRIDQYRVASFDQLIKECQ